MPQFFFWLVKSKASVDRATAEQILGMQAAIAGCFDKKANKNVGKLVKQLQGRKPQVPTG